MEKDYPLTADNVQKIFFNCLFQEGEPTEPRVEAEGVMLRAGFHPERLKANHDAIKAALHELEPEFRADGPSGGMSFLRACVTRKGDLWGQHDNVDQLLVLGVASGQAKILLPRNLWKACPGGVPYFAVIGDSDTLEVIALTPDLKEKLETIFPPN